jgi:hypothetical protein
VLNPSEATFESVKPLLAEAHALAASRYRGARGAIRGKQGDDMTTLQAYQTAPGRTAGTVETKDVNFGGTS